MKLLQHFTSCVRVVPFCAGVISIFHWNGRVTAFFKMTLFFTAELLAIFLSALLRQDLYGRLKPDAKEPFLLYSVALANLLLVSLSPFLIWKYFACSPLEIGFIGNEHAMVLNSLVPEIEWKWRVLEEDFEFRLDTENKLHKQILQELSKKRKFRDKFEGFRDGS